MKKYLIFDCPDEENEFINANNGSKYHSILWDLRENLIKKIDHPESIDMEPQDILDFLNEELDYWGISL